jgi:hypothetical protein
MPCHAITSSQTLAPESLPSIQPSATSKFMFSVLLLLFTSNSLGCGKLPVDMDAVLGRKPISQVRKQGSARPQTKKYKMKDDASPSCSIWNCVKVHEKPITKV